MHRPSVSLLLLLSCAPALAQDSAPVPDMSSSLGQMLFGLAVVIAILFASLWAIKRLSAPRGVATHLKVLGAAPVGPRERVVLVELADKVLVLGVAQGSVSTLHVMDAADLPAPPVQAGGGKDFSAWLRQSVEQRKHGR